MNKDTYPFAELRQEDIVRIRQLEESLAESTGHPITLIAFESPRPSANEG
ncbi:hypothetical protein [Cohnella fermenti]|nr:hypothetical protein [Cohnella fermenti]